MFFSIQLALEFSREEILLESYASPYTKFQGEFLSHLSNANIYTLFAGGIIRGAMNYYDSF